MTDRYAYAIDNRIIVKLDKANGKPLANGRGRRPGPIIHMDSGVVRDGKLYTAHSNYPDWPMTSSIEVWDAESLKHLESHSFGIERGSLTWLDRDPQGRWWGLFANYNRVFDKSPLAYGNKYAPRSCASILTGASPSLCLSRCAGGEVPGHEHSGGAFGPDGRPTSPATTMRSFTWWRRPDGLGDALAGDHSAGDCGQGFAFDPSDPGVVWGIIRGKTAASSLITVSRLPRAALRRRAGAGEGTRRLCSIRFRLYDGRMSEHVLSSCRPPSLTVLPGRALMPGPDGTDSTKPWIAGGPVVILVEPQLGENVGSAARAMGNFGLSRLAW